MTSWPAEGGKHDKASDELFARTDRIQSASWGGYPETKGALAELGRQVRHPFNPTESDR
jgi:hypothetical protein